MSDSLRDQLVKAGLVSRDQANRAEAKSRRKNRARQGQPNPAADAERERAREIARAEREKQHRDRDLNRQRDQQRSLKTQRAALRRQLAAERMNTGKGEITHYFQSGKKIKQVMVSAEQNAALAEGRLAVVVMDGVIHLVGADLARQVRDTDPQARVVIADPAAAEDPDEAYREFPVPDDLQW